VRGCFITGTDTGVGKSVLSAAIVATLRARGHAVRALKPILTGLDEPPQSDWPADHELLARAAGCRPEEVTLETYGPAVSPHLAVELSGRRRPLASLLEGIGAQQRPGETLVVEGVGGLLVPLDAECNVRDLARELGLPLIVAARPGLGTINHTLLTLEAARAAGVPVSAVVLTPWRDPPNTIERSNRETIELLGEVEVQTLPMVAEPDPQLLAHAGRALPLERWLA
jgi:dethiobiotin synthetase